MNGLYIKRFNWRWKHVEMLLLRLKGGHVVSCSGLDQNFYSNIKCEMLMDCPI